MITESTQCQRLCLTILYNSGSHTGQNLLNYFKPCCCCCYYYVFDYVKVSVVAVTPCRYLRWNRQQLEMLFSKEQHLMTVMLHIIGRDITNKLYQFTGKASATTDHAQIIRLKHP